MNDAYFFISKPRCASTHLYEGLTGWNDAKNGSKPLYHIPAIELSNRFHSKYNKAFSFSVVRNPYDLVVSWYNEHKKDKYETHIKNFYDLPFKDWLNKGCPTHWPSKINPLYQHKWLYDNDKCIVSYIIKMEQFQEGLNYVYKEIKPHLPQHITIESINLIRKNESSGNTIILTPEEKSIIYSLFKKDFMLFNYYE